MMAEQSFRDFVLERRKARHPSAKKATKKKATKDEGEE